MTTPSLDAILDEAVGSASRDEGWRHFGLLRNPFPSRVHPIWDVFYDQRTVRTRFLQDLKEFLRESNTITLFFTGGNRVGKTHFMEHHRRALSGKFGERELLVPIAVVSAQACDFWQFYLQAVEQLDESIRIQTGAGLFERPLSQTLAASLPELPPGDFRRAAEKLASIDDEDERVGSQLLLRRWLRGERLRAPQRRNLGVSGLLDSQAQLLNAFESLVKYLLLASGDDTDQVRCPGVLIFLDEFELVWKHRRDRRDQFLQALRATLDSCTKGVFLCVGMATGLGVETQDVELTYPALFQRLKGARDIPALVQIDGPVDAIGYEREFEKHGRHLYELETGSTPPKESFYSDKEIQDLYFEVAGAHGRSVSQGDFFDRLHVQAEQRLAARSAKATR